MSSCIINEMGVKTWYKGIKFFLSFFPSNFFLLVVPLQPTRRTEKILIKKREFSWTKSLPNSKDNIEGYLCWKKLRNRQGGSSDMPEQLWKYVLQKLLPTARSAVGSNPKWHDKRTVRQKTRKIFNCLISLFDSHLINNAWAHESFMSL